MPDNVELLFQTLQGQLVDMRDEARERDKLTREEAKERHAENKVRLDHISGRLDSLERWRAYLVGAWAAGVGAVLTLWALAREWRPWAK
jgi:hypothetical protein